MEFVDRYKITGPTHIWKESEPEYDDYGNKPCYKCSRCGAWSYPEVDYDLSSKEHIIFTEKYTILYLEFPSPLTKKINDLGELYTCGEILARNILL